MAKCKYQILASKMKDLLNGIDQFIEKSSRAIQGVQFHFYEKFLLIGVPPDKATNFLYKSESIANDINGLHLPKHLKKLFFHTSHGGRVQFNRIRITAKKSPLINIGLILKALREAHTKHASMNGRLLN